MINNKKGSILDMFLVIIIVFMFAITLIIAMIITKTVDNTGIFEEDETANAAINTTYDTLLTFDNMMLFIIVGLSIFVLVSSAFVFNHPAFFFVGVVILAIAVTFAAMISNTYDTFTTSSTTISTESDQLLKINFLILHLPKYILFMGFSTFALMYMAYSKQYG